ncbi:MAG: ISAzo13 family transposase [Bryobacterales bacterium]|nr:ISAzo13 family transposase [Bryobacterales bacterium]MDE0626174.1 ISAzo13 family transposase [Bryobacterales bacterium]
MTAILPLIGPDIARKELIGRFRNGGVAWTRQPEDVFDHDFPSSATGKAVPYGIYDLQANTGWVGLGLSSDTPCFAVDCLAAWWAATASRRYPGATQLLLLADSGGSNGYRPRAWKYYLQHTLCNPFQLTVTVAHYSSGCSKFNPIEHRLFSEISKNWSGVPLETVELILNYVRTTKTKTGLRVRAELMPNEYRTGFKVGKQQMDALTLTRDATLPQLNYTISPNSI